MAASEIIVWVVGGMLMGGVGVYLWLDWYVIGRERQRHVDQILDLTTLLETSVARPMPAQTPEPQPVGLRDPMYEELLTRLMDAALPRREDITTDGEERPGSPGEYEAPPQTVGDWTDPFIGLERSLVGGLRPGEGIPGIGGQSIEDLGGLGDDAYATAHVEDEPPWLHDDHPEANGYEAVGEDLYAAWEDGRGEWTR